MTNKKKYKIFICATEQSGDNIGYHLISEISKHYGDIEFDGVGGNKMATKLKNQFFSISDFNSMGIIEVIFSIKKYIKMINYLLIKIKNNNYDLIITIDSPDFNYPLIKKIVKTKINVKKIQIVAPTVWAWRSGRASKFAKVFDEIFILFDFERKYFEKYNLKTTLIGHPIHYISRSKKLSKNIAFLPGSRKGEINKLFKYFNLAYNYLYKYHPNITIFIPTLPHLKNHIINNTSKWKIKLLISTDTNEIEDFYSKCSHALVCSGTASLEIAKRNIPQLIIYKFNILTEYIAKPFVKIKYANLINIVENKMIIPEITNSNLNKDIFMMEFKKLIENNLQNEIQINKVNESLKKFEVKNHPYKTAAERILNYL